MKLTKEQRATAKRDAIDALKAILEMEFDTRYDLMRPSVEWAPEIDRLLKVAIAAVRKAK